MEADAWRFYRWWIELDEDALPDLSSQRLFEMLERLPLMQGALTARATLEAQQEQQPNNSGTVSGVPVGSPQSGGRPSSVSGVAVTTRPGDQDVRLVESTGRNLAGHEALAGLVEYVQVDGKG